MNEQKQTQILKEHGITAAYALALQSEAPTAGPNAAQLKDLGMRMDAVLKAKKMGKTNYWTKEAIDRLYVQTAQGKKAGYIEVIEGKLFYREISSESPYLAIFRQAAKAQKEAA